MNEKISSVISLIVAIVVLVSNYFQWWNITYNGKMETKTWVKWLFYVSLLLLVLSLALILI